MLGFEALYVPKCRSDLFAHILTYKEPNTRLFYCNHPETKLHKQLEVFVL